MMPREMVSHHRWDQLCAARKTSVQGYFYALNVLVVERKDGIEC